MNWTSPQQLYRRSWDRPIRRGPLGVLTVFCSGVRRILPALVRGLALGSPLADASALVAGMTRTNRSCVALRDAGSRNRAVSLPRLAVNSARPSLVAA
jgi:hypothetical protein